MQATVLMSVHNSQKHLREAIESILGQTFIDLEFLIIDDGSSDNSFKIIKAYHDKRIRVVKNKKNLGLTRSLNKGIDLARGEYVVRMDADDISLPKRLEEQVKFMNDNPHVGIAGTWIEMFGGTKEGLRKFPRDPRKIKCNLLFETVLTHPSVIIRKSFLDKYSLRYDPFFKYSQDYDLWSRAVKYFDITNIPEPLLLYRNHPSQLGQRFPKRQYTYVRLTHLRQLMELGIDPSEEELDLHYAISRKIPRLGKGFSKKAGIWFKRLKIANQEKKIYPEPEFSEVLKEYQQRIDATSLDFKSWLKKKTVILALNLRSEIKKKLPF